MGAFDIQYGGIAGQPLGAKKLPSQAAPINPNTHATPETIVDVRRPNSQAQVQHSQSAAVAPAVPAIVSTNSVNLSSGPTVSDGAGGVYTPERASPGGILAGMTNLFKDSAQAARSGVGYDEVRANRLATEASVAQSKASTVADPANGFKQDPFDAKPEAMGINPSADGRFMTGKDGAKPDSRGGGFTAPDGTSYNVNKTSQDGIAKVTATGKNPLYTNIKPEDAVSGLNNQMIGGNATDVKEGIDRFARANATRQQMIDSQPAGGVAILPDYNEAANAEKTQRWREDELLAKAGRRGAAAALQAHIAGGNALALEQLRGTSQQAADQGRNAVTMRGQNLTAQSEANRLAGNPLDNATKQAQLTGIMAQGTSAQTLADLQQRAVSGDARALETLRSLNGKTDKFSSHVVGGGEDDAGRKLPQSLAVTGPDGRVTYHAPNQQQGGAPKFSSPADVAAAKAAGKLKAGDVIETPNGLMKVG